MKALAAVGLICVISFRLAAQEPADSTEVLEQVVVRAYENNRKLKEVPVAVSVVTKSQLSRFNNISLVPALNMAPGVRMEERSPGSYRLNIRGSSLRSPFGVRNVKVYYNDIPYTDPGGNSFLNQLGLYNIGRMEVIKGPGGSLYGAGTGGVVLISNDLDNIRRGATVDYTGGSYGMNNFHLNLRGGEAGKLFNSVHYQYQNSDGYRDHTRMERKVLTWDGVARVGEKGILRTHFMQGDLFYETPGGLTAEEFAADPKGARPGVEEAHAGITQKVFLAGLNYSIRWNDHWKSSTSLYGAYSRLQNPALRNFEKRSEPHYGSRNIIQYTDSTELAIVKLQGGIELQQGFNSSRVYGNVNGRPDTMQTDDDIVNRNSFIFVQATVEIQSGWTFTAGASFNLLTVEIERLLQERKYNNEVAPRLGILKKLTAAISAYASIAKGFSPPTTAELLPSTGIINTELQAEHGVNIEAGLKGNLLKGKLYFDINSFYFRLQNTIAQRRDINGADYFVNAGSTKQSGMETFISYKPNKTLGLWGSHTWNNFRYANSELDGKKLPGIPANFLSAGLDLAFRAGIYGNLTYYYSDPVELNDANNARASSYHLLGGKIGYRRKLFTDAYLDVFAVADNLFDAKYSLGNDINAFGGRNFNVAPGINYAAGISLRYSW